MDSAATLGRWDIFCRVIDNHGDIGVCWRLAADLAARGTSVRLWVDDASALRWMAPGGAVGVSVQPWQAADTELQPGDVVIEAFGCELPPMVVERMASADVAPVWINLEYLSAEAFVARSHGLPSPQSGRAAGLRKWFYYPGFTPATGGLVREADLAARQRSFDAAAWLRSKGIEPQGDESIVSLFCYEQPALDRLLDELAQRPTLLLATHGHAARQVERLLGPVLRRGLLRAHLLPALTQTDFDHLLWSCELNFVRGEDSFVRAQWAGVPFVWQIYPQTDGADAVKLQAFLDRFLVHAQPALSNDLRRLWSAWNGGAVASPVLPELAAWHRHCRSWRGALAAQPDLVTRLLGFVAERR